MVRGAVILSLLLGLVASSFMRKKEIENSHKTMDAVTRQLNPNAKKTQNMEESQKELKKALNDMMKNRYENLGH